MESGEMGGFYLAASVLCSVSVALLLKLSRRAQWPLEQMILMNYAAAAGLCAMLLPGSMTALSAFSGSLKDGLIVAALGVLLPAVFLCMGATVREAGLVRTDAAQRLSLFLSLGAAFVVFHDQATVFKLSGIVLALLALICLVQRPSESGVIKTRWGHAGLVGVWAGYGVIDVLFKLLAQNHAFSGSLLLSFIVSFAVMLCVALMRRRPLHAQACWAGLGLGVLNFGNIYCYISAHQAMSHQPSLVFAGMNMGVIALSTLVGAGLLRERISRINIVGVVLALLAISVMFYGMNN